MRRSARYTEIVMGASMQIFKNAVAAFAVLAVFAGAPALAADESTASLLAQLRQADPVEAKRIEREIRLEWAKSGSSSLDILLKRGTDALEAGETETALGHFTALTDHAPEFAEGWHSRAMAFFHKESYGLALHDLERTLLLNPDHFGAIFGLAVLLETLDRDDDAFRLYEKVLELHPNHEDAKTAVGRLNAAVNGTEI